MLFYEKIFIYRNANDLFVYILYLESFYKDKTSLTSSSFSSNATIGNHINIFCYRHYTSFLCHCLAGATEMYSRSSSDKFYSGEALSDRPS